MNGWPGSWAERYMGRYIGSEKTNQYMNVRRITCVCGWQDERTNTGRQINKQLDTCGDELAVSQSAPVFPNKYAKHSNGNIIQRCLNKTK
jgi:hypothetical protein